jgi:hypothetical protein
MKKGSFKSYLILLLTFLIGIGICFYLFTWYKVIDNNKKNTPIIRGTLTEINDKELDNYLLENSNTVLYLCTSDSVRCRNYEKDFKKIINSKNLKDDIVYVNLTGVNQVKFVKHFNNKYYYKTKLTTSYPALIVFDDGQIVDLIEYSKNNKLTSKKTINFLEDNHVGEYE